MNTRFVSLLLVLAIVIGGLYWVSGVPRVPSLEIPASAAAIERGEYLYNAGGCASCHQPGDAVAAIGGYEIESPFGGTFVVPNITPDVETGIGGWTGSDFILALKNRRSPGGGFYWPSFPYRSYSGMTDEDVLDIAAYMMAQPAIRHQQPDHDLPAWQFRWMMAGWNRLADFMEGSPPAVPDDPQMQRGAYLARHFSHCGECHTPRNAFGIMDLSREYEGSDMVSSAITPAALRSWTRADFVGLLELGMTASFDFVGGEMAVVVEHTNRLSAEDKQALAAFFLQR